MKAILCPRYGPPDVLQLRELPQPEPGPGQARVKVHAKTVNRTDCAILRAQPAIMRLFVGLRKPRQPIPGTDYAGVVEAVGSGVANLKPGDRVFSFNDNGLASSAEYLVTEARNAVVPMPRSLDFADAAACIEGFHYARNFVNKVPLAAGARVLVNGASGAIGSAALQLCKAAGAHVTAVCQVERCGELLENLGADALVDYPSQDFTQLPDRFDFVFDSVGKSAFGKCRPILKPRGVYISSELGPGAQNPFLALVTPLFRRRRVAFPFPADRQTSLESVARLADAGQFRPLVDRRYPLERTADAYRYVETGEKLGNVVIDIPHSP